MQNLMKTYTRNAAARPADPATEVVRRYAPVVYRTVRQVASRLPPGVDREELFSAGMLGLLDALEKFDSARGIDFENYARIRIKGAILDELRNIDHLSRRMRHRSRALRDAREALGDKATDETIAEKTGLSIKDVRAGAVSDAAPSSVDQDVLEDLAAVGLWQEAPSVLAAIEWEERVKVVSEALGRLPEKNRLVLGLYYEAELTLREIGDVLGVTQSRVSQILRQTVDLLKAELAAVAA